MSVEKRSAFFVWIAILVLLAYLSFSLGKPYFFWKVVLIGGAALGVQFFIKRMSVDSRIGWVLTLTVFLAGIIGLNLLILQRVLRPFPAHDIANIPFREEIITKEGYLVAVQERNYKSKFFGPGQAARYVKNTDILKPRRMDIVTDQLGLRNPPGQSGRPQDVILMGDSQVFGYSTDQPHIVSQALAELVKKQVYNLGVYGTSPSQEVELLRYLLLQSKEMKVGPSPLFVLCLFAGNDFTDTVAYKSEHIYLGAGKKIKRFWSVYKENTIEQMIKSALFAKVPECFQVLGSQHFGSRVFLDSYVQMSRIAHGNKDTARSYFSSSQMGLTFDRLQELSGRFNASIMVVYLPSASMTYGKYFEGHPPLEGPDHILGITQEEALKRGFKFVDFSAAASRLAEEGKMLFWPDDTHLNEIGHAALARTIAAAFMDKF